MEMNVMPELPEVETIREVIAPQLRGRTIRDVRVARREVVAHPDAEAFCARLRGQTFEDVGRRGKFLLLTLAGGDRIAVHLRMTGCLLVAPAEMPPEKHTHAALVLDGGIELRFSDPRRFGRLWLLQRGEDDDFTGMSALGPEPFDAAVTADYLMARCGQSRRAVKACLLDQRVVAGLGNIYSDEILFAARIAPSRPANRLTREEWARIAGVLPQRLADFVEKNRIGPEAYLRARGREYRNTPFLQVYGRAGKPCPVCGAALCRAVVAGRSSVFCPRCQEEPTC